LDAGFVAHVPDINQASPIVVLGIALNILAALVFGGLHLLLEAPPLRTVAWPGAVALAAAYAVPAALAAIALRGQRPATLLGAGLVGLPLAFTAMSGVSLVLVLPAACYLIAYVAWTPRPPPRAGGVVGIAAILAAGVAALVLLFASPSASPRDTATPGPKTSLAAAPTAPRAPLTPPTRNSVRTGRARCARGGQRLHQRRRHARRGGAGPRRRHGRARRGPPAAPRYGHALGCGPRRSP
jgi:hypothetical protein